MGALKLQPDIFAYHDYRKFLLDWIEFKKSVQSGFSLRALAKGAGLASGYLPMVLAGKRQLSLNAWSKLEPLTGLNASEKAFFRNILTLGNSDSHVERLSALDKMQRSGRFQKQNPLQAQTYEYLTHWYYVAIRELAAVDAFKEDMMWIQTQLNYSVTLQEVKTAFDFLLTNGYLSRDGQGKIQAPTKIIDGEGGAYRVALGQYHRELLALAALSIEKTPSDQRQLTCHTVALSSTGFDKAREIVNEALEKIRDLGKDEKGGDSVYHMEIALFPLAGPNRSSK